MRVSRVVAGLAAVIVLSSPSFAAEKPLYTVVDGNKVDADTLQGWKTWRALACERCHGAAQEGMVGPSLIVSLQKLTKEQFHQQVMKGNLPKGMPPFESSPMAQKNWEKLYAYLKGRSEGKIKPGRLTLLEGAEGAPKAESSAARSPPETPKAPASSSKPAAPTKAAPAPGVPKAQKPTAAAPATAARPATSNAAAGAEPLRVCADPSNMPLSNRKGEGYENRIAEALAEDLGRKVEYTFFPQRMGFVRNTLRARDEQSRRWKCDLIIGVPKDYELTATTQPWMRSTYVMLFDKRPGLDAIRSPDDLLRLPASTRDALRIGIFGRSPAADWLLRNGMLQQAVPYAQQSGDPSESPGSTIERDLQAGKIDVAILWGPIAAYLVDRHPGRWTGIPFGRDPQIKFDYEISMGLRQGEKEWKQQLDSWIEANQGRINEIVASYHVPLMDDGGNVVASPAFTSNQQRRVPR